MSDDENNGTIPEPANAGWQPMVGPITTTLRDQLGAGRLRSVEAADRVIREAVAILSQCVPPTAVDPTRIGLVCGYVQSGKTASMTAVSALARDNAYRIVILLAGVNTNLVEQNRDRLQEDLRRASPNGTWLMLENPKASRDRPAVEAVLEEWNNEGYDEQDRRTLFISVMKHHKHLQHLTDLLAGLDLTGIPAIIFDDEADQASLNTQPQEPRASATYRNIFGLRAAIPSHTYLQYTATPQAPLLITRIDSLSADFVELVSPGEGYTGGECFFGAQARHQVERIPPSEVFRDDALPLDPPASLLRALQVFFIGVASGLISRTPEHRSMLIHPSKSQDTHRRYYDWTTRLMAEWHRLVLDTADPEREFILAEFAAAHQDLARTCQDLPDFELISSRLHVAINRTMVTLVNSEDGHEVPWPNSYSHILVGGEKLGRGYTVKGITVTYMPRPPGGWTADTIQQRARFFGYHSEYLGYCRVYLHPQVRDAYVAYVDHEADLRARLAEHRGKPLREWRRLFYLDRRLAPTRRNVLMSPYLRPRFSQGWFEPQAPHMSPEGGEYNLRILSRLDAVEFEPDEDHPRHKYAVVPLQEIFEHVLVPFSYFDEQDALGLCVVNCALTRLLEKQPDARCLVYRMDDERDPRTRRLDHGVIPTLFQGESSAGADSYPGDRAFCDRYVTTVQIHTLRLVDKETEATVAVRVPAIAVHLMRQDDLLIHDE